MSHLDYINFFQAAARKHQEIADGQLLPSGDKRESFFKMNSDEQMQQSLMNSAAFPALSVLTYDGKLSAQDKDLVTDNMYGAFDVRDHVPDANDYDNIEAVRDRCKRIGGEIIALMLKESSNKCSLFKSLDVNSIRYKFIGPMNLNEYGCTYYFNWKAKADGINDINLDQIFSL